MSCLTPAPSICQNVILLAKRTFLNVGPILPYLGIFRLGLEKATVLWYFTSGLSNFSKHKISTKNKNKTKINFGTKIALIEYFRLEFQKSNVLFEIRSSNLLT